MDAVQLLSVNKDLASDGSYNHIAGFNTVLLPDPAPTITCDQAVLTKTIQIDR